MTEKNVQRINVKDKEAFCIPIEVIDHVFFEDEYVAHLMPNDKRILSRRICQRFEGLGWRVVSTGPMDKKYWHSRRLLSMLADILDQGDGGGISRLVKQIISLHKKYFKKYKPGV